MPLTDTNPEAHIMSTIGTSFLVLGFLVAAPGGKDSPEKKRTPRFTVGKETTYATGPLDKDGYVDYAAALNERLRQGVTPANNANVLLWKAMGPHPERITMPSGYFKWLGIEAPPERGEYFIDLARYAREHVKVDPGEGIEDLFKRLDRSIQRPWTAKEYPDLSGWLKVNEKPLALVVEATKRSHYFSPLVPQQTKNGPAGLMSSFLSGAQQCREFANALTARAMLRVGEGACAEAWQDLLACHRLGRLVGGGGTLIEGLVGMAIDAVASKGDLAYLDRAKLSGQRIARCLRDLQKLPPLPDMADKVNLAERFMLLDVILMVDRHGIGYLKDRVWKTADGPPRNLEDVDWDPALQNANRWSERLVVALREKDRGVREKKLEQIEAELRSLREKAAGWGTKLKLLVGGKETAKVRGKAIGDILIALMILPARKVEQAAERSRQIQDNLAVAFALAWYQRDHGRYPAKLEALTPKYLKQVPKDLFSGKALLYRPSGNGYLLYSVGPNGKDEGGRGYSDTPPGDDLSVRMPLPALAWKELPQPEAQARE